MPRDKRPLRTLKLSDRSLELERPKIMGILNATPDSFSDADEYESPDDLLRRAQEMLSSGADLLDVGGESAVTNRPAISAEEEVDRVCPLIERLAGELGAVVSVDTYKAKVAEAAIAAGAVMVNDVSGLRDPEVAEVCAESGAALVIMHTRAPPKKRLEDPQYEDLRADVLGFLKERMEFALSRGVEEGQLVVDPGPDFAMSPAQTIELLSMLPELHELGRPLLLAASRKDFVGALTWTKPRERLAGTLAAVAHGLAAGAHIFRVHDVRQVRDFIDVWLALDGAVSVPEDLEIPTELRWQMPMA